MNYLDMNHKKHLSKQRGTVLIVALFIMVLLEVTVAGLVIYQRVGIRSSNQFLMSQKAIQYAYAGEAWSRSKIQEYYAKKENIDEISLTIPVSDGYVDTTVVDLQGHFNVNNLINENEFAAFKNMMASLLPNGQEFANAIIQIIQNNRRRIASTDTSGEIMMPLSSITQLRTLKGMTAPLFKRLLQHCIALPVVTPLNINTATAYSLMTLSPNMTQEMAQSIISARDAASGKLQLEMIRDFDGLDFKQNKLTVLSEFYLSSVVVRYENMELTLYSLIRAMQTENRTVTMVYWRSFGTL